MRIVFVTCPPDSADKILLHLVEHRLVAGGNIISNVKSIYHWDNKVIYDNENILLMETTQDKIEKLILEIRKIHPYEIPKIVTFFPQEVFEKYKMWVEDETTK